METMLKIILPLLSSLCLVDPSQAWISPTPLLKRFPSTSRTSLHDVVGDNDFFFPEPSSTILSTNDLERLSQMRERQKTCPILLVENSLLPGQSLELGSADPKFLRMTRFLQEAEERELCVVGMHPYTGEPLSVGVTVSIEEIDARPGGLNVLIARGTDCVDVQGRPWWDSSKSCYMAKLEVAQDERHTGLNLKKARKWFEELPALLDKWCSAMERTGRASRSELKMRGWSDANHDKTTAWTSLALSAAALLNPSPAWESPVCLEIRPALLACRNDYDRLHLVHTALQASLQHLRGESNFSF